MDGEETSRDSDTSPNYVDRRITDRFDETEAANMLGIFFIFPIKKKKQEFFFYIKKKIRILLKYYYRPF